MSIKMAKEQGLSLNPSKISGTCGRLMCCLKNEQSSYEELLKITPKVGAFVKTPECKGYVEEVNLITGKLKIKPEKTDVPIYADRKDVKVIKDAEIRVNKEELKALKDLEKKLGECLRIPFCLLPVEPYMNYIHQIKDELQN